MTMTGSQRIAATLVMAGSFTILAVLVWSGDINALDMALHNWALGFNTPTSVAIWEGISFMGSVIVLSSLTFLSLGIFAMRHDWHAFRLLALAMSGAVGCDTIMKWIVQRPRPDEIYAHTMPTTYSFPSGHALYSFTFYLAIAWIVDQQNGSNWMKGVWGSAVVMVVMIGASRIFLGVHYGSDVLGGYLIAAVWLLLVLPLAEETQQGKKNKTFW